MPDQDDQKYPPVLYRYRPMQEPHDLTAIQEGYLWFSRKSELNDPFEFSANRYLEMPDPVADKYKLLVLFNKMGMSKEDQVRAFLDPNLPRVLEHQKEVWERGLEPEFDRMLEETRVCCFTENPDNVLMWGHYGNGFKGVVFGYDPVVLSGEDERVLDTIHKVDYPKENAVPDINVAEMFFIEEEVERKQIARESYGTIFATKSNHWSYEEEWRATSKEDKFFYDEGALIEVIFGELTTEEMEHDIRGALEDKNITYKRAVRDDKTYSFKIIPA